MGCTLRTAHCRATSRGRRGGDFTEKTSPSGGIDLPDGYRYIHETTIDIHSMRICRDDTLFRRAARRVAALLSCAERYVRRGRHIADVRLRPAVGCFDGRIRDVGAAAGHACGCMRRSGSPRRSHRAPYRHGVAGFRLAVRLVDIHCRCRSVRILADSHRLSDTRLLASRDAGQPYRRSDGCGRRMLSGDVGGHDLRLCGHMQASDALRKAAAPHIVGIGAAALGRPVVRCHTRRSVARDGKCKQGLFQ